jgi:hypothetical protein
MRRMWNGVIAGAVDNYWFGVRPQIVLDRRGAGSTR